MEQTWKLLRRADERTLRCPLCHDALADEAPLACATCEAAHHAECWTDLEHCAACGARGLREASPPAPPIQTGDARRGCSRPGCERPIDPRARYPEVCRVHATQITGFAMVCAAGASTVLFALAAWIGAMDPSDHRFPMQLGMASVYYGLPVAILLIGLLLLGKGVREERAHG